MAHTENTICKLSEQKECLKTEKNQTECYTNNKKNIVLKSPREFNIHLSLQKVRHAGKTVGNLIKEIE